MNPLTQVTEAVVSALETDLTSAYTQLVVRRGLFRPAQLPTFHRYAIMVAPGVRPLREQRISVVSIQYWVRLDLFLLVKNWDTSEDPLFGTAAGRKGIFELVVDVKAALRGNDLGGILDKTYDEPAGDESKFGPGEIEFQDTIPGFDAAEYAFVHRVRLPYRAQMIPFCPPRD